METLIGILVNPIEAQRIVMPIETMQAQKPYVSVDDCLNEILSRGVFATATLYINNKESA